MALSYPSRAEDVDKFMQELAAAAGGVEDRSGTGVMRFDMGTILCPVRLFCWPPPPVIWELALTLTC